MAGVLAYRVSAFLLLLALAPPAAAVTLPPVWASAHPAPAEATAGFAALDEILAAQRQGDIAMAGRRLPSPALVALQLGMVAGGAALAAAALPRPRIRDGHRRRYAAFAAWARSRIRPTMARSPFERCADRCASSPSRASSPAASTARTSPTVRPS